MATETTREQGPRVARVLGGLEGGLASLLLLAVLGLVVFQVVTRYLLNSPVAWTEELARFALIWLTFIGAAYVAAKGRHVTVVVGSSLLGVRGRALLQAFASLVVVAVCVVLVIAAPEFLRTAGRTSSPAASIPMAWVYGAAVLGIALIGLHSAIWAVWAVLHPEQIHEDSRAADQGVDPT